MDAVGPALVFIDHVILAAFVLELLLKFVARDVRMFRDPWTAFDAVVVGLAFLPASGSLSALRALRLLRLISVVPSMRRVVGSLLRALPGLGSVAALILLVMYVGAVIGLQDLRRDPPRVLRRLNRSLLTLFQVLTVEGWPDIQREVMTAHPYAWLFFVPFLLISTFVILNLFVGVIVEAMQSEVAGETEAVVEEIRDESADVIRRLDALSNDIAALRRELAERPDR
jgi:voltage-gated sodium channel